jgi:cell division inhibitor SulA/protein ImuA
MLSGGRLETRPSFFMNLALAAVLNHPALWRGGDCAPEPAAIPTGFAMLDRVLPGGGWPRNALTEMALTREGIGEIKFTLPALARIQAERRLVVWIAPPYRPYAPALVAAGIDVARLCIVRCRDPRDALWSFEQALRAPECGAAFAWLATHDERALRRLAVAARDGRAWGVLWRRPGQMARAACAPLRLALASQEGRLAVRVEKRRGADLAQPILIDLGRRTYGTPPLSSADTPPVSSPLSRARVVARPDPRTSAGHAPQPYRRLRAQATH